jgi:hypothetical protein
MNTRLDSEVINQDRHPLLSTVAMSRLARARRIPSDPKEKMQ